MDETQLCFGGYVMDVWLILLAYLLGSIPYSWLAAYYFGPRKEDGQRCDLRDVGSGNVGASNTIRILSWKWYVPLVLADASKGFLAVTLAHLYGNYNTTLLVSFIAVLGHCFPIYLGFKRGKGVSTSLGVVIGLGLYIETVIAIVIIVIILTIGRIPSFTTLCSILAFLGLVIYGYHTLPITYTIIAMVCLIIIRHKDNIRRLVRGEEPSLVTEHLTKQSSI